jgi:sucrose-phosphate synthase
MGSAKLNELVKVSVERRCKMHIAFFNPQGNFDNDDSYWTEHPDFGGQLVYVKELALALDRQGHDVVIFTRRIQDPEWPEFSDPEEMYHGAGVRIVRLSFGGKSFLNKEALWPFLHDYVLEVKKWYNQLGKMPDFVTTHYGDGGIAGAMFQDLTGIPYTFTAHSLGAQKLDKLVVQSDDFPQIDKQYKFTERLAAERIAIDQATVRVVSTAQEKNQQYQHPLYKDMFASGY